ncbi:MAG: filamentous hemagglutinin N-terminal domain-containing protein [Xenococcus sp. (in: cyanobacteria)]
MRNINKLNFGFWLIIAQLGAMGSSALAQITPDTTLPNNSAVTRNGEQIIIDQGTVNGSNLFHSFSEFNVRTGETAIFNNEVTIDNIITRVTGGQFSNIDGFIEANSTTNLFLLNPNGINFGPNASLNIGGSFIGSTAESFLFEDGSIYSATNPAAPPLLTVNVPLGLQYGSSPNPIQIQGSNLEVKFGQILTLAGGDLDIVGGTLQAPNGRISLGSATTGILNLDESLGIAELLDSNNGGNINLSQQSLVEVTGASDGIDITTGNLTVTKGSRLQTVTEVPGKAGNITLNANDAITIDGFSSDGLFSGILSHSMGENGGIGGNITINQSDNPQSNLTLSNRGFIATVTEGNRKSGNIEIKVNNLDLLSGGQIISLTTGNGDSGNITLNATEEIFISGSNSTFRFQGVNILDLNQLEFNTEADDNIENSETIPHVSVERTATEIKSGATILGTAEDGVFDIFSFGVTEAGSQGVFDIDFGGLEESTAEGHIDTEIFLFNQKTGEQIGTNDDAEIVKGADGSKKTADSYLEETFSESGTYVIAVGEFDTNSSSFEVLEGNPVDRGDIYTLQVSLENQGTVIDNSPTSLNSDNFNPNQGINSGFFSVSEISGNSGNIIINAGTLTVDNQGEISTKTLGAGNGGNLQVNVEGIANINDAILSTISRGNGDTGIINIEAENLLLTDSEISASNLSTEVGDAGNIDINAGSVDINSFSIETLTLGAGKAGSITIDATNGGTVNLSDSSIKTNTFGEGNAGNVSIRAGSGITLTNTTIDPAAFGDGKTGNITIEALNESNIELIGDSDFPPKIYTDSFGSVLGKKTGGNLKIIGGQINIDSYDLVAVVNQDGQGNGGDISITGSAVKIQNGSSITTKTHSEGDAGSITIDVNGEFTLSESKITTSTSGQGDAGNLDINVGNTLLMRDNSLISAKAEGTSDGGDITIDTNFIVAIPNQNNDIIANATAGNGGNIDITDTAGNGGNIDITAKAIFGLEERKAISDNVTNDIDASSEFGLAGTVVINNPDVDPTSAIVELPAQVTDPSDKVVAGCAAASGNSFTITGQGGLPEDPNNTTIYGQTILSDLRDFTASDSKEDLPPVKKQVRQQPPRSIVQVNSWVVNQDGEVELVAALPQESSFLKHPNCQDLGSK